MLYDGLMLGLLEMLYVVCARFTVEMLYNLVWAYDRFTVEMLHWLVWALP